jgi:hypothetical protein
MELLEGLASLVISRDIPSVCVTYPELSAAIAFAKFSIRYSQIQHFSWVHLCTPTSALILTNISRVCDFRTYTSVSLVDGC